MQFIRLGDWLSLLGGGQAALQRNHQKVTVEQ